MGDSEGQYAISPTLISLGIFSTFLALLWQSPIGKAVKDIAGGK
jgi:hypothetical protein